MEAGVVGGIEKDRDGRRFSRSNLTPVSGVPAGMSSTPAATIGRGSARARTGNASVTVMPSMTAGYAPVLTSVTDNPVSAPTDTLPKSREAGATPSSARRLATTDAEKSIAIVPPTGRSNSTRTVPVSGPTPVPLYSKGSGNTGKKRLTGTSNGICGGTGTKTGAPGLSAGETIRTSSTLIQRSDLLIR